MVVSDDVSRASKRRLGEDVAHLETLHALRHASNEPSGGVRARIERAVGHGISCFVCTRSDLISGEVARVLDLRPWEAPFVDRIVFASIVASAMTVWGEDLVPQVPVPSVRRLDVFKALFGFSSQVLLSAMVFPVLPDATKYAMGALKHSLHAASSAITNERQPWRTKSPSSTDGWARAVRSSNCCRCAVSTGGRWHLSSAACRPSRGSICGPRAITDFRTRRDTDGIVFGRRRVKGGRQHDSRDTCAAQRRAGAVGAGAIRRAAAQRESV